MTGLILPFLKEVALAKQNGRETCSIEVQRWGDELLCHAVTPSGDQVASVLLPGDRVQLVDELLPVLCGIFTEFTKLASEKAFDAI